MGGENKVDKNRLWQSVLGEMQVSLTNANFNTWFKNTEILEIEETKGIIRVPNTFTREWLKKNYEKDVRRCLARSLPQLREIEYATGVRTPRETLFSEAAKSSEPKPLVVPKASFAVITKAREQPERLNPRYTFESFVVGESNRLAQAAAEAVAKAPGITYNPLFIYGGVGLGKTHILQAIGNEILTLYPTKRVVYVTSERFTNELVGAIQQKTTKEFKEKYRKVDCLLIDDVQFLAGKEATQAQFFHTFNI